MKKVLILCAAALMAACSADKSMFSDEARQENLKKNYTEGFKSAFPNVSLNQNWDYSNKNASYSLAQIASANSPVTRSSRAINYNVEKSDVYEVDQTTLQWMKEKLTDYTNHRELGNPFYIKVPNNGFTVVPIYQGQASNIF
ncbi:MAG: hypothetical protein IJT97_02925, partial [Bacteroidaceae bacterium]|nr:hypothetical protein [Bacteroidaceae bacterium]